MKKDISLKRDKMLKILIVFALISYIFSIPSFSARSGLVHYAPYLFLSGLGGLVFAFCFLHRGFLGFNIDLRVLSPFLFAFYVSIPTVLFSHVFSGVLTLFFLAVSYVVLYFSFMIVANKKQSIKIVCFSFLLFAFYFIFHYVANGDLLKLSNLTSLRFGAYFDNVNAIGVYFLIGLTTSFYLGCSHEKRSDLIFFLIAILFFGLGCLTQSRAFFISAILSVLLLFVLFFKNNKKVIVASSVIFSALVISFFVLPVFSGLRYRFLQMFATLFGDSHEISSITRVLWQQYAFYLGSRHFLFGLGYSGFSIFSGVGTYSHGNFFEIFCDFGFLGLVIFHLPFFFLFSSSFKSKEKTKYLCFSFYLIYAILEFIGMFFYNKEFYVVLSLLSYLSFAKVDFRPFGRCSMVVSFIRI